MVPSVHPEYYSATEYPCNEKQIEAIIRVTAYHRKDYCLTVIWFPPQEHERVRPSIQSPFGRVPSEGLGFFGQLPEDLLYYMLIRLDLKSLFLFRQLNLSTRKLVDSTLEYQAMVAHGLDALCALLRTGLAAKTSLHDFYSTLCTKYCSVCGDYAGFVSLLAWSRFCFQCLREAEDAQALTTTIIQRFLHLTKDDVGKLRTLKTLPGTYSMKERVHKSRLTIASTHEVAVRFGKQAEIEEQSRVIRRSQNPEFVYLSSCALPYYNKHRSMTEYGISCAGCQLAIEKGIISSKEGLAYGARKVYSHEGFLKHFKWCKQAQILWESSDGGQKQGPEYPSWAQGGGFIGIGKGRSCGHVLLRNELER